MAKTPEAVRTFLEDLADKLQPLKAKDIETFLKFKKEEVSFSFEILNVIQGPVVQNFVSLTLLLSPQFVKYISTSKANSLLFFVEKNVRILCKCKGFSHFFQQKIAVYL